MTSGRKKGTTLVLIELTLREAKDSGKRMRKIQATLGQVKTFVQITLRFSYSLFLVRKCSASSWFLRLEVLRSVSRSACEYRIWSSDEAVTPEMHLLRCTHSSFFLVTVQSHSLLWAKCRKGGRLRQCPKGKCLLQLGLSRSPSTKRLKRSKRDDQLLRLSSLGFSEKATNL